MQARGGANEGADRGGGGGLAFRGARPERVRRRGGGSPGPRADRLGSAPTPRHAAGPTSRPRSSPGQPAGDRAELPLQLSPPPPGAAETFSHGPPWLTSPHSTESRGAWEFLPLPVGGGRARVGRGRPPRASLSRGARTPGSPGGEAGACSRHVGRRPWGRGG